MDAAPDPTSPPPARRPVGAVARRIAQQVEARVKGHGASGDAFVVSVYGEWGVGKTFCLQGVRDHFANGLDEAVAAFATPLAEPSAPPPVPSAQTAPAVQRGLRRVRDYLLTRLAPLAPPPAQTSPSLSGPDTPAGARTPPLAAPVAPVGMARGLVVPVWFDPWQYEHEEHLVVPLLKTIEHAVRGVEERMRALSPADGTRRPDAAAIAEKLRHAGDVFGDVAVALASGFKFKLSPLKEIIGVEVDLDPKAVFESSRSAAERRAAAAATRAEEAAQATPLGRLAALAAKRESFYFDTRATLERLVDDDALPLRLVVLVDDLDRCLPEKAVQVLESVKLFLNARGFSFVLAVDDEVVERGIAHRYRDYRPRGGAGGVPVSGAEYLEKIVHLPVHLPRWTADEARRFLRGQAEYRVLFDAGSVKDTTRGATPVGRPDGVGSADPAGDAPAADRVADDPARATTRGAGERTDPATRADAAQAAALLDLVVTAVPLVPRKLIRLAEALVFMRDDFAEQGQTAHWDALHAARIVALQQLYPPLYRHLRLQPERYWRLFAVRRDSFDDPCYEGGGISLSLPALESEYEARGRSPAQPPTGSARAGEASAAGAADERVRRESRLETLVLLRLVQEASRQRGAPDPLRLFRRKPHEPAPLPLPEPSSVGAGLAGYEQFAQLYMHGLPLPEVPATIVVATGAVREASVDSFSGFATVALQRPEHRVADQEAFVARLLDADAIARRAFMEREGLDGVRLPGPVFERLLERLASGEEAQRTGSIEWLRDVARCLDRGQLLRLYRERDVVGTLLRQSATRKDTA